MKILLTVLTLLLTQVFASALEEKSEHQTPSQNAMYSNVECLGDQQVTLHGIILNKYASAFCHTIRIGTQSNWNHVATLFVDPTDRENQEKWWILEATIDHANNTHLQRWLNSYFLTDKQTIETAVRFLTNTGRTPEPTTENWKEIMGKYLGRTYTFSENLFDTPIADLLEETKASISGNTTDRVTKLFCSQLTALVLKDAGFLNEDGVKLSDIDKTESKYTNSKKLAINKG